MTTQAEISRTVDALIKVAKKHGIQPHIWIAKDGSAHLVAADALTPSQEAAPAKEDNIWDVAMRS